MRSLLLSWYLLRLMIRRNERESHNSMIDQYSLAISPDNIAIADSPTTIKLQLQGSSGAVFRFEAICWLEKVVKSRIEEVIIGGVNWSPARPLAARPPTKIFLTRQATLLPPSLLQQATSFSTPRAGDCSRVFDASLQHLCIPSQC